MFCIIRRNTLPAYPANAALPMHVRLKATCNGKRHTFRLSFPLTKSMCRKQCHHVMQPKENIALRKGEVRYSFTSSPCSVADEAESILTLAN